MNTDIRRKDRMVSDKNQIKQLVDKAKILHLGLIDHDFPYIVPMHYGYEYDEKTDRYVFYLHAAKEGHKINVIQQCANVCIELESDVKLDANDTLPCNYGSFYSSFIARGTISIASDIKEKQYGLQRLMHNQSGKLFTFTEQMLSMVTILKIEVHHYTAKARLK